MRYSLRHAYLSAKCEVTRAGFNDEVLWQKRRFHCEIGESELMRESAWVILNGGMRERVVRGLFFDISKAFLEWESARSIVSMRKTCRVAALKAFNHPGKIDAIISFVTEVASKGRIGVLDTIHLEGQ